MELLIEVKSKGNAMFKNFRLKTKLLLAFSVVLGLMLLTSGLAYKQFIIVGHEIDEFASIVKDSSSASHIETLFLKLRGHAREYANTAHENDAKAVYEIGDVLNKELDYAIKTVESPKHKAAFIKMKDVE